MGGPAARNMFGNFTFEKSVAEISAAVAAKIEALKEKISDRIDRVACIRKEFDISDADLISLLSQANQDAVSNRSLAATSLSYNVNASDGETKTIQAGVVQNLLTEQQLIEQEKDSVTRLSLIRRNLRPITHFADDGTQYTQTTFRLSEAEIDYLGF